ncbi:MAG: YggT family protein [Pyrinomonadaceae bacterium]
MIDNKLEVDEVERTATYETAKNEVRADVEDRIALEADRRNAAQAHEIEAAADEMRRQAVGEVVETQRDLERARAAARVSQIVDYVFFLIYALLSMRLMLELFAARESAGFFRFVKAATDPFYYPFRGLMPSLSTADGFTLVLSLVAAIVAYMLLHLAINGFLRMIAHRKVAV